MSDRRPEPTRGGIPDELVHERASATPSRGAFEPSESRSIEKTATSSNAPPLQLSLHTTQRWLSDAITHAGSLEVGIRAASQTHAVDDDCALERIVTAGPRLSAFDRLGIYHYAYRARLIDCLADDFPAVQDALGREPFADLCRDYIAAHPSTSPNLVHFGKSFAAFCASRAESWATFAAELATLEWAMTEVVHAADAPALDLEVMQKLAPEQWAQARFTPSATLRLLRFQYPVNAYFQAFRREQARAIPPPHPTATAVYRQALTIWRMDLTPSMAGLLHALCAGDTLGHALEGIAAYAETPAAIEEAERNMIAWFSAWVAGSFFATLEI